MMVYLGFTVRGLIGESWRRLSEVEYRSRRLCVGERGPDVVRLKVGVVVEDLALTDAPGGQAEDEVYRLDANVSGAVELCRSGAYCLSSLRRTGTIRIARMTSTAR